MAAFATTCVGRKLDKEEIIATRLKFIVDIASTLEKVFSPESKAFNLPGNCPEYLIFGIVCRKRGRYRSLCLSIRTDKIFKFCNHCESLMRLLNEVGIQIDDYWNQTSLKTEAKAVIAQQTGYSYVELKSFETVQESFDLGDDSS